MPIIATTDYRLAVHHLHRLPAFGWPETTEVTDLKVPDPDDDVLIELRDVYKSFGDKHILCGASLKVSTKFDKKIPALKLAFGPTSLLMDILAARSLIFSCVRELKHPLRVWRLVSLQWRSRDSCLFVTRILCYPEREMRMRTAQCSGCSSFHFISLRPCCCQIRRGEAVGVIGPSGTGKSTILKIMAGLLAPDKVCLS